MTSFHNIVITQWCDHTMRIDASNQLPSWAKRVTSRANPVVKQLAALHTPKGRADGLTLVEGVKLVRDAFTSGIFGTLKTLVIADRALPAAGELMDLAQKAGTDILSVTDECYDKITDLSGPEGVAATWLMPDSRADGWRGLVQSARARLLVAAGVAHTGNAGALARIGEAAGADALILLDGVDPANPRFLRAAAGSAFRLPCFTAAATDFLAAAKAVGLRLIIADGGGKHEYREADYSPPAAVVMGGEGGGVPAAVAAVASEKVRIPMCGKVESLNVSVAAGILLYQAGWRSRLEK